MSDVTTDQPWTHPNFEVIGSRLGKVSYGSVWKARHNLDNCEYAVKQVFVDISLRKFKNVEILLREVKNLQSVNSGHVVRYHSCWFEGPDVKDYPKTGIRIPPTWPSTFGTEPPGNNFLFIQMELCDFTLKHWMIDNPSNESRCNEVQQVLTQLAQALKIVHEYGIVHRDLKPDNIFYITLKDGSKLWKIGDFGVSKMISENDTADSVTGCPFYESPDKQVSMKSDVFTMGLIFLEILNTPWSIIYEFIEPRIHADNVTQKSLTDYPKEREIICGMLNHNQVNRFDSEQVLERLDFVYSPNSEFENRNTRTTGKKPNTYNSGSGLDVQKNEQELQPVNSKGRDMQIADDTGSPRTWFEIRKPAKTFVGRDLQLNRLRNAFKDLVPLVVVCGLGGVGKSELVKQYALTFYKSIMGHSIWITGNSVESFRQSIQRLAKEVLPSEDTTAASTWVIFKAVYQNLMTDPILLIFDNVNKSNEEVENFLLNLQSLPPDWEPPFVIITTRNRDVFSETGGELLELNVLEDKDALELITKSIPNVNKEDSKILCQVLQNYPLALKQAICFIRCRRTNCKAFGILDYLKLFEKQKKKILDQKLTLIDHDYSLTTLTTWIMSFESIKSEREVGKIAEDILNFWAYALNPDGEDIKDLINFFQVLLFPEERDDLIYQPINEDFINTGKLFDLQTSDNQRVKKQQSSNFRKTNDDIEDEWDFDITDDERPVAKAIVLIRTYSMCDFETRWNSFDYQVVTIHRLVQEVIRVTKRSNSEEEKWLLDFQNLLSHPYYLNWSNYGFDEFDKRVKVAQSVWKYMSKYETVVQKSTDLFINIWRDCPNGYLSELNRQFVEEVFHSLAKAVGNNHLATVVMEYFYWLSESQHHNNFGSKRSKTNQPLLGLTMTPIENQRLNVSLNILNFFNRLKPLFRQEHRIRIVTLDLLGRCVLKKGLIGMGTDEKSCVKNGIQVFFEVLDFLKTCELLSGTERLLILSILGRILEAFVALQDIKGLVQFTTSISEWFEKQEVDGYPFLYLFKYVADFLDKLEMTDEADKFIDNLIESNIIDLDDLNYIDTEDVVILIGITTQSEFASVPASVVMKIISDIIEHGNCQFNRNGLIRFFDQLHQQQLFESETDFALKALELCKKLGVKGQFASISSILVVLKSVEQDLWKVGRIEDCIKICQHLPRLCKYRNHMEDSDRIVKWIDDIILRISQSDDFSSFYSDSISNAAQSSGLDLVVSQGNQDMLDNMSKSIGLVSETKELIEIGDQVLTKCLNNSISPVVSVSFSSKVIISVVTALWGQGKYRDFQSLVETVVSQFKTKDLCGYLECKIAPQISKMMLEKDVLFAETDKLPISTAIWAFCFVLEHHGRLVKSKAFRIVEQIVKALEDENDYEEASEFGKSVSAICEDILNKNSRGYLIQEYNFWYCLYSIGIIGHSLRKAGKDDEDLFIFRKVLKLGDKTTKLDIITKELEAIDYFIQHNQDRSSWDVITPVICNLIIQNHQYGVTTFTALNEFIKTKVETLLLKYCYVEVVHLSECLSEVYHSIPNQLNPDHFTIKGISNYLRSDKNLLDLRLLFQTILGQTTNEVTKTEVENEIDDIISELIQSPFDLEDSYCYNTRKLFCFILKYGQKINENVEALLIKIIDHLFDNEEYGEIYKFGGQISCIPNRKIRFEFQPFCLKSIRMVIDYLRKACEENFEKMQRIFLRQRKYEMSVLNNRNEFVNVFDKLTSDFNLELLEDDVYWETDNSDNCDSESEFNVEVDELD